MEGAPLGHVLGVEGIDHSSFTFESVLSPRAGAAQFRHTRPLTVTVGSAVRAERMMQFRASSSSKRQTKRLCPTSKRESLNASLKELVFFLTPVCCDIAEAKRKKTVSP